MAVATAVVMDATAVVLFATAVVMLLKTFIVTRTEISESLKLLSCQIRSKKKNLVKRRQIHFKRKRETH